MYAALAAGRVPPLRIDRTGVAIVGAILMIVTGAISFEEAVRAIDARTLVLLFSMMVIVAHLRLAGGLSLVLNSARTIERPAHLLVFLVFSAGILSALFVNDTVCLVFTPLVLDIVAERRLRPLPFLLALATGANIGSVATITGNPQNMLIGSVSGLHFARFTSALAPVALAGLAIDAVFLCLWFRRDLRPGPARVRPSAPAHTHRWLLGKSVAVMSAVLGGLLAGFDPALVGAGGVAVLLLTRRVRPTKLYEAIDWDLLMLFVGLFVIVGAGARAGLDRRLFEWLAPLGVATAAGLSATAVIVCNAVSNVPAVMLFTRLIPQLPNPDEAWLALAMSSTLSGNLTLLGSIANLIVVEGARRRGVAVTFLEYTTVGIPLTLATLLAGLAWLSLQLY